MDPVILIALVDETLRDTYGLLFAEQGYRVLTTSKVLECLHKVRWLAPEVLVLDEELWDGEEGMLAISGEDILWPSVVLLTRRCGLQDEIPLPPVVACLESPADFGRLLEEVMDARRISFLSGGTGTPEAVVRSSNGSTSLSRGFESKSTGSSYRTKHWKDAHDRPKIAH